MTKSVRAEQIEKISNGLQYQGYIVKQMWSLSNEQLKKLWVDVRNILLRISTTLRTDTRILPELQWKICSCGGKATMDTCFTYKGNSQSLLHVVLGYKVHLQRGRYTWRHNSILATLLRNIDSLRDLKVFADIPGTPSPQLSLEH